MKAKSEGKRYFKMQYPEESRPIISARGRSKPVTVLSEKALVVLTKAVSERRMGQVVSGVITYPNGNQDEAYGYIIFIKGKNIIIKLLKPIPIARINEQQQWVHQHYLNFDMRMK